MTTKMNRFSYIPIKAAKKKKKSGNTFRIYEYYQAQLNYFKDFLLDKYYYNFFDTQFSLFNICLELNK